METEIYDWGLARPPSMRLCRIYGRAHIGSMRNCTHTCTGAHTDLAHVTLSTTSNAPSASPTGRLLTQLISLPATWYVNAERVKEMASWMHVTITWRTKMLCQREGKFRVEVSLPISTLKWSHSSSPESGLMDIQRKGVFPILDVQRPPKWCNGYDTSLLQVVNHK